MAGAWLIAFATELRRAFDYTVFEPTLVPGPEDWLARHPEKPQSFQDYLRADKNVPDAPRHVICVVAGSNSQEEADRSPLHACPVCLRKLHAAIKFDPAAREDALAGVFGRLGIDDEAAWSAARATWIRNGVRTVP